MATIRQKAQGRAAPAQERGSHLDWGHLRFFLELVRTGSHARAARRLGVDRNTVARHVAALEAELGLALFERGPQGWSRTPAGEELSELAGRVEEDVLALARHVDARDPALRGTARLTTVPHLATHLLAPALPALRQRHPDLMLEVVADARAFDLSRREADLALRTGRPRDPGLVARRLSPLAFAFYAAATTEAGARGAVDLQADPFLGEEGGGHDAQERWLEALAPGHRVVHRCNSTTALLAAARHGVGVAQLPCYIGDAEPTLRRLDGPEPRSQEIWLLVHGDLRRTPRVRAVIEWVDDLVERARPALLGRG
jgi:DNA-binding transcriptional LysR family regulator